MSSTDDFAGLSRLGAQVAAEQDALLDAGVVAGGAEGLAALRARLLSAPLAARARSELLGGRTRRQVVLLAAAALGIALLGVLALRPAGSPLSFTVGEGHSAGAVDQWLSATGPDPLGVDFSDGTKLELSPEARVRITAVDAKGAAVAVESGHAAFAVTPGHGANWRVTLGPFAVHVTGTRFDVDWDPGTQVLLLRMQEGRVVASGCVFGEGRPVVAGEVVRASCKERRIEITSQAPGRSPSLASATSVPISALPLEVASAESAAAPDAAQHDAASHGDDGSPKEGSRPADATASAEGASPDWRKLAQGGNYRAAFAAADAEGFDALCASAAASDLFVLGDAARLSGQLPKAERAYHALRQRFPGDRRAAVAAFTLARIAFDQRGAYAKAAQWFDTYLREQPRGSLAREALGRLIEARQRSGDHGGARRAADEYLGRYPSGPHAELAHRVLAE